MMGKRTRSTDAGPTMMIHHIKEIQLRFLVIVGVLVIGMVVGYFFYEPLFAFIKAPLDGPLHYTSPAGSFSFVVKICLMVGVIAALPVAVYNLIMFLQPALKNRLSKLRVYLTTLFSLLLAGAGAAFAFTIIIPMALEFFYKFQVDGLVALISADQYLQFVMNVVITFVVIFQLPLIISLIDHITPLPPKKLLKAEKFIIIGSIFIGVLVPFALDPVVQLLIASPIIILYNLSIGIVLIQHSMQARKRRRVAAAKPVVAAVPVPDVVQVPLPVSPVAPLEKTIPSEVAPKSRPRVIRSIDGTFTSRSSTPILQRAARRPVTGPSVSARPQARSGRLITDIRRGSSESGARQSIPAQRSGLSLRPVVE